MAPGDDNVVPLWDEEPEEDEVEVELDSDWSEIKWVAWEKGVHDGWSMQRYHSADEVYARVEFALEGGYPPEAFIPRAAGTAWSIVDSEEDSENGTLNCYYERR